MRKRLSFRVRDEIVSRLESGDISPGAKLPPEPDLAAELGVSRPTLREALRSLEEDGFVTRTSGAGTYVTRRPRLKNNLDVNFGVTEAIRAAGMEPGTRDRLVRSASADAEEALALDLAEGEPVVVLDRVRTADGRPVVFSADVVPASRVSSSAIEKMPPEASLYDLVSEQGEPILHGIVTIEPVKAPREIAKRLGVKTGTLMLHLRQVDYGREGQPLMLSYEHHLADAFEFTVVRRGPGRRDA